MNKYIAYCGLNCETCDARLATIRDDNALRSRVAREWTELNRVEITPDMINCVGCRLDGVKTPFCQSLCAIRQCAIHRSVDTCGSCGEMDSCDRLAMITARNEDALRNLKQPVCVTLRERPELMHRAAEWFHLKWSVPREAYLDCMTAYLKAETEYGWYLCLFGEQIAGGLGVIQNDFHNRKDLAPNICAVYTEEIYRGRGIAGRLLNMAVEDLRGKGITPVYLVTDHTGFYERYGWQFFCMVQGEGDSAQSRLYIHH